MPMRGKPRTGALQLQNATIFTALGRRFEFRPGVP
jgi:hypothetical protein